VSDDAARELLWERLGFLFAEDDGSLPEVHLVGLSAEGLSHAWDLLLRRAEPLPPDVSLWHRQRRRSVPLRDLPRPTELVSSGQASSFHVLLRGIEVDHVPLPDLGAFIEPSELALDYRMGSHWQPHTLAAFVELLGQLQALNPEAQLDLEVHADPGTRTLFTKSLRDYLSRS
jgi:hypothetical protein